MRVNFGGTYNPLAYASIQVTERRAGDRVSGWTVTCYLPKQHPLVASKKQMRFTPADEALLATCAGAVLDGTRSFGALGLSLSEATKLLRRRMVRYPKQLPYVRRKGAGVREYNLALLSYEVKLTTFGARLLEAFFYARNIRGLQTV